MPLKANTLFANRYQLVRLLGRGGFSEVWLAKDSYTRLEIAIKVYAPGQGMDTDGLVEFSQELAGVFNLNHTNLLKPTHVDAWEGMPYLILPYCAQGSIVKRVGKMSEDEIWKLIHDVASGLAYLHEHSIVHQDIKPDNILMDDNGHYLITDFGISTKARSTLRKSVPAGTINAGTMAYMGPERFSKQPAPTRASDIWSFGAMVYELITGNAPFEERGGIMLKNGAEIPEINEPVSDELKQVIEQMLALDPKNRPSAKQLVEIATNHPATAAPVIDRPTQRIEPTSAPRSKVSLNEKMSQTMNTYRRTAHTTQSTSAEPAPEEERHFVWKSIIAIVLLVLAFIVSVGLMSGSDKSANNSQAENVEQPEVIEGVVSSDEELTSFPKPIMEPLETQATKQRNPSPPAKAEKEEKAKVEPKRTTPSDVKMSGLNEEGTVIVQVRVNEDGKVVYAECVGGTISDRETINQALSQARKATFAKGDGIQTGTITYRFVLN